MNGGTSIIPNLDSIEQFRVLTNNFDPEYGNYNGGMITVVSKSGSNQLHGDAFEFFRNTALDAQGYFDLGKAAFNQSQFGGTIGGPVRRDKLFFFTDYQGTRTTQGIATGKISVPSVAERGGNFSDVAAGEFYDARTLQPLQFVSGPCVVAGSCLADVLSQRLGYAVIQRRGLQLSGMQYQRPDSLRVSQRDSSAGGVVRARARIFSSTFRLPTAASTSSRPRRTRRRCAMTRARSGSMPTPAPGRCRATTLSMTTGSTIPIQARSRVRAFLALTRCISVARSCSAWEIRGPSGRRPSMNFTQAIFAMPTSIGQPKGGLGVSLASQGFATGAGTTGIVVQAPQFEGVQNIAVSDVHDGCADHKRDADQQYDLPQRRSLPCLWQPHPQGGGAGSLRPG